MKALALFLASLYWGAAVAADPPWIFGMHDPGGESHATAVGKRSWIVFTEALGADPNNQGGADYRQWSNAGHGVIVRLNYGYNPDGTLPPQARYADFAQRVANFVRNSHGAKIWIIGNETNLTIEWPDGQSGEPITVARYVDCFRRCRTAIRALPGHETDQVAAAGAGTYGPPLPWAGIPGFLDYWTQVIQQLGVEQDAFVLHAYTHGSDPNLIFSNSKMGPPYQDIFYHFRVYRNYLSRVPTSLKHLPVYITESDMSDNGVAAVPWPNVNNGWIKNAYREINDWNSTPGNQVIRALCLYRWLNYDVYGIEGKTQTIQDWRDAMANDYRWTTYSGGRISGYVRDESSQPIAGAHVTLPASGQSADTDANGLYTLTGVASGAYTVVASKSNYALSSRPNVTVTAPNTTSVSFVLTRSTNLLANGDFESGFSATGLALGWSKWISTWSNPMLFSQSVNPVYGPTAAQKWGRSDGARLHGGIMQTADVEPGRAYLLDGWIRFTATEPSAWVEVGYDLTGQVADGEANTVSYRKLESGGQNTWLRDTRRFLADGSRVSVFVKFGQYDQSGGGPSFAWADDFSLSLLKPIAGRVTIPGWRGPTLDGSLAGQTVAIALYDELGQLRDSFASVALSATGDFEVETQFEGAARIRVSRPGCLSGVSGLFAVTSNGASDADATITPGDTDESGEIDDADLTVVVLDYGVTPEHGYTDADGSGSVDDADLTLALLSFGLTSD